MNVCDERGGQFVRRTTGRVQHVPPLFAGGRAHRPDDGAVGCTGSAAEAAGDLLLFYSLFDKSFFRRLTSL